jgi:hypothetical protein
MKTILIAAWLAVFGFNLLTIQNQRKQIELLQSQFAEHCRTVGEE